ncbi:uncharacterized protein LOC143485206 [Brachyhypopomus gauderio]|uniref:uncharacterized protein LOC143485206 n=1 Tax=Brachyhypopomus gauderio TaxID=698409 RepID=UPI004042C99D
MTNTWRDLPTMINPRSNFGIERSVEAYNPMTNTWRDLPTMINPRSNFGIERSVEAYNPMTNTWRDLPTMINPRSNFGIEVVDDLLFVVGGFGFNGVTTTFNVERYDEKTH